jgi:hypothetical protein
MRPVGLVTVADNLPAIFNLGEIIALVSEGF